jgi:two-component system sensor histidine kinase RegB
MRQAHPAVVTDNGQQSLKRLSALRWGALGTMSVTIVLARLWLDVDLPLVELSVIIVTSGLLNLRAAWRARTGTTVGEREIFGHLLADTATLAAVLYFSGGWANPFVSMFLLPLVVAATILTPRHAWYVAGATLAAYTSLGFLFRPLPHMHHGPAGDFDLHVLGMWVSFVLAAGAIAYFVVRMAASLRERDRELAQARERALRDQHVLTLGTMAAGAAHQLGTPLSTMAVMLQELGRDHSDDAGLATDLSLLRRQVDACKAIISDLVASAGQSRSEGGNIQPLDAVLQAAADGWRVLRPGVEVEMRLEGPRPAPLILADRSVSQTLTTLLDNAADASPEGMVLQARWTAVDLYVEITDRGAGVRPEVLHVAGRSAHSTKGEGRGVGLLIANAALERLGGRVTLSNRPGGGARTTMELPLAALAAR